MQPMAPRLSTMVAAVRARMAPSAAGTLSAPAAIMISSSVPTMRSHSGSTEPSRSETRSDLT